MISVHPSENLDTEMPEEGLFCVILYRMGRVEVPNLSVYYFTWEILEDSY